MSPKRLELTSANEDSQLPDEDMSGTQSPSDLSLRSSLQSEFALQTTASNSSNGDQETPIKRQLRYELAEVVDVASHMHSEAGRQTVEVKQDAYVKMRSIIGDQRRSFELTAAEFENSARDVRDQELAHQKSEIEADALSVIQERDQSLTHETKAVLSLRNKLKQLEDVANSEFKQKNDLMQEANSKYDALIAEANAKHESIAEANERSRAQNENLITEAKSHVKHQYDAMQTLSADLRQQLAKAEASLSQEVVLRETTKRERIALQNDLSSIQHNLSITMHGGDQEIHRLNAASQALLIKINELETQYTAVCQNFDAERLQLQQELDSRASQSSLECERLKRDLQSLGAENHKLKIDLHAQAEAVNKLRIEPEAKLHAKTFKLDEARIELELLKQAACIPTLQS